MWQLVMMTEIRRFQQTEEDEATYLLKLLSDVIECDVMCHVVSVCVKLFFSNHILTRKGQKFSSQMTLD